MIQWMGQWYALLYSFYLANITVLIISLKHSKSPIVLYCAVMHMVACYTYQKIWSLTRCYVAVHLQTTSVTKSKGNRVFCVQVCRRKVEKYKVACACEASQHHLCVHLSATVLSSSHTHRAVDFIGLLNCLYREYYNPEEQLAALNISECAFLFLISRIVFMKAGYSHTGVDVC